MNQSKSASGRIPAQKGRFSLRPTLFLTALAAFVILVNSPVILLAQTFNSGLRGTISDPSGGALGGATATFTDGATQQVRKAITDGSGEYAFNEPCPSTYTLHIEATGFSVSDRTHIQLSSQDFLTLYVALAVGAEKQEVQASSEVALVDPSTTSVSTKLNRQRLEDLPILGRNPYMSVKVSGTLRQ